MNSPTHPLDRFFHPRSVAVIGASATPGNVGNILLRNLLSNPFGGVVYPINPKRKAIHGVRCAGKLAELPETVDLAVIAVPAKAVPATVSECIEHRVPNAIIISAGFSELGAEGRALESAIRTQAQGRIRLIGPNCLGIIHPPSNLNASFAAGHARPGRVALLSQSGAICTSILDWANQTNIGFSTFVSVGAMVDVDFADLIDYFGDDPATGSIVIYMESIGDVRKFLSAARAVARTKPIIVVKSGRHELAAKAAASHTGAMAGADAVFDAAFARAGILRVQNIRDLFNMSEILAMQPLPRGASLGIITNAGGPGVMAVDALMLNGGRLAELAPATMTALNDLLPPFWSRGNPIDLLGDARPETYRRAVEICAADRGMDGLLILLTPQAMTDPTETARLLTPFAGLPGKPILASWIGGSSVQPGRDLLNRAGIPTFDTPEAAIRAFLHLVQYRCNQDLLYETPPALPEEWTPRSVEAARTITEARQDGRTLLTEAEAKTVLQAYDIPTVRTVTALDEESAVAAAREIGYPVVVKLQSPTITHKSDVGGVRLNLCSDDEVRSAVREIRERVSPSDFASVSVQRMILGKGIDLIVGASTDRQFGPVILFGAGGIYVEVFQDSALSLPPLNRSLARQLIERTRISKALAGVRGLPPVPMEALELVLVRLSQLLLDVPSIRELDINPLLATSTGVMALDARIVLAAADAPTIRPAISPYPNQYTGTWRLRSGEEVTVRVIRPEDEPLMVALFGTLSERSIRMRFFRLVKSLSRESLIRLCHLDYEREIALGAFRRDEDGRLQLLGVSSWVVEPGTADAEFAVLVCDACQGQGLGYHLLERLTQIARERGIRRLFGPILRDNVAMLELVEALGFTIQPAGETDILEAFRVLS